MEDQNRKLLPKSQGGAHRSKSNEEIQSSNDTEDVAVEDTSPLPPLQYTALADKEIRVLTIDPGQRPAPVITSLERIKLSTNANYNALSYTWGDASVKRAISCYGEDDPGRQNLCRVYVTQSCFKALHRLRHATEPRRFWIDAICINQEDLSERSSQVEQMGEVYKCAQAVQIYLVEEDVPKDTRTGSEEAIEVLRELADGSRDNLDRLTTAERASFVRLVGRSWFTRAWIMQEVFNATHYLETRLICGEYELPFYRLNYMAWARRLKSDRFEDAPAMWPGVFRVLDHESYRSDSEFVGLLVFTRGCKATDPRDKVYALLPLLEDWDRNALAIDYRMDVEDLYLRFAKYLACRSPLVLAAVDHRADEELKWRESCYKQEQQQEEGSRESKLPSWAPDLRQGEDGIPIWPTPVGGWRERPLTFWAGGEGMNPKPEILPQLQPGHSSQQLPRYPTLTLRVRGIRISQIAVIDPDIVETSLLDLAVPGKYSSFRKSWIRMQMSWKTKSRECWSMEQLAFYSAALPMSLETAMSALNLMNDAEDDPGNRDLEAHPLQNSLNDALAWPRWKEIRENIHLNYVIDKMGIDASQPNDFLNDLIEGIYIDDPFGEEVDQELAYDVVNLVNGRRIFVSEDGGRMGVAPAAARVGDVLCIVFGVPIPLVLRPISGGGGGGGGGTDDKPGDTKYLLVGGCYVNGLMQKDAIDKVRARRAKAAGIEGPAVSNIEDVFDII